MITTNYIIRKLRTSNVDYFTPRDLMSLFKLSPIQAYPILRRLKRGKLVAEVEKGKYFTLGLEPEKILSNPYFLANKILSPSYISFWTALNFYGLTEQVPFTVFIASTRKKPSVRFGKQNFKYVRIASRKFFGYERILYGDLPVLFADREKAILDSLDQPQYAGGISEIAKCLDNALRDKKIRVARLTGYAVRMGNKTLCSRLGYLLEKLGINNKPLKKHISRTFVLLDGQRKKSKVWDKQWMLNINITERQLFAGRES